MMRGSYCPCISSRHAARRCAAPPWRPLAPDIRIHRDHHLGLKKARKIALAWAEKAEKKLDLDCTYEEGGDTQDMAHFSRSGIKGQLQVEAQQFKLAAELGFLFSAFKGRIEAEIAEQIDALLA